MRLQDRGNQNLTVTTTLYELFLNMMKNIWTENTAER